MTRRAALVTLVILAVLVAAAVFGGRAWVRERPQDFPWTKLDLRQPIGWATGRKLTGLTRDYPACQALLDQAGAHYLELEALEEGEAGCGYADGLRMEPAPGKDIRYVPKGLGMACPVAAALWVWERQVVQPEARRILGQEVTEIHHMGSYNCRRMYNRESGSWSEHSTADAVDISGFTLADGAKLTLKDDWTGTGKRAQFLRAVRDGACDLFATALSPDYNAAHHDHFHFDQAERGEKGWRACR